MSNERGRNRRDFCHFSDDGLAATWTNGIYACCGWPLKPIYTFDDILISDWSREGWRWYYKTNVCFTTQAGSVFSQTIKIELSLAKFFRLSVYGPGTTSRSALWRLLSRGLHFNSSSWNAHILQLFSISLLFVTTSRTIAKLF